MTLAVSKSLYSKEVILKTAYSFTDRVYIHLDQNESEWLISWKPKHGVTLDSGDFENELVAQSLRLDLLEKTKDLRTIILARAYASTMMDNPQGEVIQYDSADHDESIQQAASVISDQEKKEIMKGWFD